MSNALMQLIAQGTSSQQSPMNSFAQGMMLRQQRDQNAMLRYAAEQKAQAEAQKQQMLQQQQQMLGNVLGPEYSAFSPSDAASIYRARNPNKTPLVQFGDMVRTADQEAHAKLLGTTADNIVERIKQGQNAINNISDLEIAMGIMRDANWEGGLGTETMASIKSLANKLGFDVDLKDLTQIAQAKQIFMKFTLDSLAKLSGSDTDRELQEMMKSNPSLMNTTAGNILMLEYMRRKMQTEIGVREMIDNMLEGGITNPITIRQVTDRYISAHNPKDVFAVNIVDDKKTGRRIGVLRSGELLDLGKIK